MSLAAMQFATKIAGIMLAVIDKNTIDSRKAPNYLLATLRVPITRCGILAARPRCAICGGIVTSPCANRVRARLNNAHTPGRTGRKIKSGVEPGGVPAAMPGGTTSTHPPEVSDVPPRRA